MANSPRVSQAVVEVLLNENGPVRNSQSVVEVIGLFSDPPATCEAPSFTFRSGGVSTPLAWIKLTLRGA